MAGLAFQANILILPARLDVIQLILQIECT